MVFFTGNKPIKVSWECEADDGYKPYEAAIAARLEWSFRNNKAPLEWEAHSFSYRFDWVAMTQVNTATQKSRRVVRRLLAWQYEGDAGFSAYDEAGMVSPVKEQRSGRKAMGPFLYRPPVHPSVHPSWRLSFCARIC